MPWARWHHPRLRSRLLKNFFRHNALRWVLFGAYVTLTLWLTANHELWRDEADSWLLARDGSVADIFKINLYPLLYPQLVFATLAKNHLNAGALGI